MDMALDVALSLPEEETAIVEQKGWEEGGIMSA
jgi:hypothetical protein